MYRKLEATFGLILATLFLVGDRHMAAAFPAVQLNNAAAIPPPTPPDQAAPPNEIFEDEARSRPNAIAATGVVTQWARRDTPGQATALEAGPAIVSAELPWGAVSILLEGVTGPTPTLEVVPSGTPTLELTRREPRATSGRRDLEAINDLLIKRAKAVAADNLSSSSSTTHKSSGRKPPGAVRAVNVERELMRSDVGFVTKSKGRRTPTAATVGKRDPVPTAVAESADAIDDEDSVQWERRAVAAQNIELDSAADLTNIWGPLDVNATDIEAALEQMGGSSDVDSTVAKEKRGGGIAANEEGDAVSVEPLKPVK